MFRYVRCVLFSNVTLRPVSRVTSHIVPLRLGLISFVRSVEVGNVWVSLGEASWDRAD